MLITKNYQALAAVLIASFILMSCQPAAVTPSAGSEQPQTDPGLKVVYVINGTLGDKSFLDSAGRGIQRAEQELGIQAKIIESGYDPARWQPAIEDAAANEDYDIMIVGTNQMVEYLHQIAPMYPDKKFILFDAAVDYESCECQNVYSVKYKQNEGSYLAGLYAGLMSKSKVVGAVGGQDIPVIQDFIVGFRQGAVEAGIEEENVIVQFAGVWNDPAKGKEIALAMYQQGADMVFQVAAGTGMGVFQAAQEMEKYAIGVDSDQALMIEPTNPDQAKWIATSMLKNVDNSLFRALQMHIDGTLPYGQAEDLGVKEGAVGLAMNKYYDELTPQEVKDRIKQAEQDLLEGRVTVDSVH